uniref:Uncharacterized protein n=1 Tax=uncultured Planctomycetota bacterium TaxID=120965 RepID=A0A1B0Z230_9BACT|nr:hypothetical protein [uncultured Planctomycetota bacterium]
MVVKSNAPVDGDDEGDGGDAATVKRTIHKPGPTVTAATRRQHRSLMTR